MRGASSPRLTTRPAPRALVRAAAQALLLVAALASRAGLAHGEPADAAAPGTLSATLACERAPEPGRVRCELEVAVVGEGELAWVDAIVVDVPAHASALRGRLAPSDASLREPRRARFPLGLVASRAGRGLLRVRARASVCGARGCAPRVVDATADVEVRGA